MKKVYENDTEVKMPKWYYKLSPKMVERISNIGIVINCKVPILKRRKEKVANRRKNVKFYL